MLAMRSDWSRGDGRNGRNSGPGPGANRNSGNASGGSPAGRWSDELDAIFERAPKGTTAPKNDDERSFFEERPEVKSHTLVCPHCNKAADYALTWLVRRKRDHPSGYADDATRARFDKARSYMVRRDDQVACQNVRCHKRFEIVGVQTVAFIQEVADGSVEDRAARIRAAFAGRSRE
jgi:hypothetical protein